MATGGGIDEGEANDSEGAAGTGDGAGTGLAWIQGGIFEIFERAAGVGVGTAATGTGGVGDDRTGCGTGVGGRAGSSHSKKERMDAGEDGRLGLTDLSASGHAPGIDWCAAISSPGAALVFFFLFLTRIGSSRLRRIASAICCSSSRSASTPVGTPNAL